MDLLSGAPMGGVQVTTTAGSPTTTDASGAFSLPNATGELVFQKNGYQTRRISPSGESILVVWMEPEPYEVSEVVLTAFDTRRLSEQDGAVSVVSPAALRRDNPVNLAPALNRVPGVYFQQATFTTNRLTIRGIGARTPFGTSKIRAYFDEIPLTNGQVETSIEDIDLSLIERVEVVRGPASSLYGAGLGGVIRLVPSLTPFGQHFAEATVQGGSFGLRRAVVRVGVSGKNGDIQLNFNGLHSDGFRENNLTDRWSLGLISRQRSGEKGMFTLLGQFIHLRGFIPSSIDSLTFRTNPRAAAANWLNARGYEAYDRGQIGGSWNYTPSKGWTLQASVFSTFRTSDEPRPFNILQENSFSTGARAVVTRRFSLGNMEVTGKLGGEYFHEWYFWRTYVIANRQPGAILSDNQEVRSYVNAFTQWQARLSPKTNLSAGFNLNQTRFALRDFFVADSINQSGNYTFEAALSPRIALSHHLTDALFLHASASHGFSPPTLSETLTPTGLVNTEIRPETGWSYEAGLRWGQILDRFSLDANFFYMDIRNLLVARRVGPDEFIGVNAGQTAHTGLELELNGDLIQQPNWRVGLFASAALGRYRFLDFTDGDNNYSGNALTGTPAHHVNGGLDVSWKRGLYGNVNGQWVSGFPMNDANTAFVDGYALANVRLGWQGKVGKKLNFDAFGGVNNVFDALYAPMVQVNALPAGGRPPRYYYPGLSRNFYAGLTVRWAGRSRI